MDVKLGAVVVLYNPDKDDFKNILDYGGKIDKTLIIDNSRESNLTDINKIIFIDGITVIYEHFPENIGLCKGMNYGIEKLKKCGCDWVFAMNSDSFFKSDIVSAFTDYIKHNKCNDVILLSPVYDYDRKKGKTTEKTREIKRTMMSGNLIHADVFLKIGGFQEKLFVEGLDFELCIRARIAGYRIIECGSAVLGHMPGKTKGYKLLGKTLFMYGYDSPNRYYQQARSLAYIVAKYKTSYELLFYIYKLVKIIFLFDNKKEYISCYFKGTRDGKKLYENEKNM